MLLFLIPQNTCWFPKHSDCNLNTWSLVDVRCWTRKSVCRTRLLCCPLLSSILNSKFVCKLDANHRTDDSILGIRAFVFRSLWTDDNARHKSNAPFAPRMDWSPFQNRLWHLLAGICGCSDKSPHCYDVGYLSTHSGSYIS